MDFRQKKDGSCTLHFNDKEIEIIKNKKSLYFTPEVLRHFGNALMRMVIEFNDNFDDKTKNIQSGKDTRIEGK